MVDKSKKCNIKGINLVPVLRYRTVTIPLNISREIFKTKFDIVRDDFPIFEAGILGSGSLKENRIVLNIS